MSQPGHIRSPTPNQFYTEIMIKYVLNVTNETFNKFYPTTQIFIHKTSICIETNVQTRTRLLKQPLLRILMIKDLVCSCSLNTKLMNSRARDTSAETQHLLQSCLALILYN